MKDEICVKRCSVDLPSTPNKDKMRTRTSITDLHDIAVDPLFILNCDFRLIIGANEENGLDLHVECLVSTIFSPSSSNGLSIIKMSRVGDDND